MLETLRCLQCNEVIPLQLFSDSLGYNYSDLSTEVQDVIDEDVEAFRAKHQKHDVRFCDIQLKKSTHVSRYPFSEIVREDFYEVEIGGGNFILRRWRQDANEPMKYQLIKGRIVHKGQDIRIQMTDLIKVLKKECKAAGISENKIDMFIGGYRRLVEEVKCIPQKDLTIAYDHPMIYYAVLPKEYSERFWKICSEIFNSPSESRLITKFVENHNNPYDVMALRILKQFCVEEEN